MKHIFIVLCLLIGLVAGLNPAQADDGRGPHIRTASRTATYPNWSHLYLADRTGYQTWKDAAVDAHNRWNSDIVNGYRVPHSPWLHWVDNGNRSAHMTVETVRTVDPCGYPDAAACAQLPNNHQSHGVLRIEVDVAYDFAEFCIREAIMRHEIGHTMGLGHTSDGSDIMQPSVYCGLGQPHSNHTLNLMYDHHDPPNQSAWVKATTTSTAFVTVDWAHAYGAQGYHFGYCATTASSCIPNIYGGVTDEPGHRRQGQGALGITYCYWVDPYNPGGTAYYSGMGNRPIGCVKT